MRIRQGPQEDRVDHAEDGDVRADAEGKGKDREGGEARLFRHHPKGVANVGKQGLHGFVGIREMTNGRMTNDERSTEARMTKKERPANPYLSLGHSSSFEIRHSARSAIMGSTRIARRAGNQAARKATIVTRTMIAMKVTGSDAPMP